ncbi:1-phosphatidylinositol 3-phosphate 5-kinase fab1 [Bienertia sinuspersici]
MSNNRTLREFDAPPPYEDVSGIASPATEANNYEFKSNLITLIEGHQFSGASHENPRNHLKQFLQYCNTVKANGVPQEYIQMSLFKFSLTGKALDWLDRLPPNSLTTWDEVTAAFLSKFIPLEKMAELRLRISTFQQEENESLFEACERFKNLLNDCPHYGMEKWLLLHSFYRGLSGQNKMCLDVASGGPIMKKDPVEAIRIIEDVVQNYAGWRQGKRATPKGGGRYDALSSLPHNNMHASSSSSHNNMPMHQSSCELCGNNEHALSKCYLLMNDSCSPTHSMEHVNALNNVKGPKFDPHSNTYNEGWRHHPTFCWRGGQGQGSGQRNFQNQNQNNFVNRGQGQNFNAPNQGNCQNMNRYNQQGRYSNVNASSGFNGGFRPNIAPIQQAPLLQLQAPPPPPLSQA